MLRLPKTISKKQSTKRIRNISAIFIRYEFDKQIITQTRNLILIKSTLTRSSLQKNFVFDYRFSIQKTGIVLVSYSYSNFFS